MLTITDNKKENQMLVNIESISKEQQRDDIDDPQELEQITLDLRDDLTELDIVEKVDLVTKEGEQAPKGSKAGAEVAVLGSLLLTLGTSAASTIIPNLTNALQSWLSRHEKRKISLKIDDDIIEVTGISDEEERKLIDAWLLILSLL